MPIFEYQCKKCGKKFEEIIQGDRDRKVPCPACGNAETEKLLSVIGGISMGKSSSAPSCASHCASAGACAAAGGSCCH